MFTNRFTVAASLEATTSLVVSLVLAGALGCGNAKTVERYAASGQVFLDGQVLECASIVFEPRSDGGVLASAPIIGGRFQFSKSNGPTAGEFDVRINPEAVEDAEALELVKKQEGHSIVKSRVPPRYQKPGALTATVTREGPNHFPFSLD